MKQSKIIDAYNAIEMLSKNTELNEQEQWRLYQVRKLLRPHIEFQLEREDALKEKYKDYIDNEGKIAVEKAMEWNHDINKLMNMDVDINVTDKPIIRFVKGVTCIVAEALDDFVEFIEA